MKKCMLMIAVAALAAGSAFAQESNPGDGCPPGKKAWSHHNDNQQGWGQMDKRGGKDRPGGPLDPAEMEQMRAKHEAIRDLAGAVRLETDPAKKAALVEQLRAKLGEIADRMQVHQEERLAQAEECLAGLKEKIEYGKTHRAELIEEQVQRILSGERPKRPAAFDKFPNAKHGLPESGPEGEMPPPPEDEEMAPPPTAEDMPGDVPPPPEE